MITGIGIDVVHVKRLKKWIDTPGLLERFFHPEELELSRSRGKGAALSLAARFAAKEALGKALGTGLSGIVLKDILVVNSHNGKPEIKLFDTAQSALEKTGASRIHISLTHERDNALAMIVLEAD
ncbi:MAG: holo-ACP synthase [Spirochaetaceae bacterium]|jgi:holo-[acyl-carrier protein] synthase|nr:holo-ACP synthase [Spirochaetaceae bacterium]